MGEKKALRMRVVAAETEAEQLRVQLAACTAVALANTRDAQGKLSLKPGDWAWSASYGDVANAVEREMQQRERADQLQRQLVSAEADAHAQRTRGDDYRAKLDFTNTMLATALDRCTRLTREKAELRQQLIAACDKVEGGYTKVEQDCRGCMGPCGRCHELADAKLAAAGVTQVPSLFGPDQPSKAVDVCPCPMCVGARGLQC